MIYRSINIARAAHTQQQANRQHSRTPTCGRDATRPYKSTPPRRRRILPVPAHHGPRVSPVGERTPFGAVPVLLLSKGSLCAPGRRWRRRRRPCRRPSQTGGSASTARRRGRTGSSGPSPSSTVPSLPPHSSKLPGYSAESLNMDGQPKRSSSS